MQLTNGQPYRSRGARVSGEGPARPEASREALDLLQQPASLLRLALCTQALATILALAPGVAMDRWLYFGLMSFLLQWVALLTLGMIIMFSRWLRQLSLTRISWIAVLLLLASSAIVGAVGLWLAPSLAPQDTATLARAWVRSAAMIVTAGLLAALAFQNHWRSRQMAVQAKQAQLDALRARVNPHFLFNSLNTATSLVHSRPDQAEQVLLDLSDLFRAALTSSELHPLEDELILIRRYLEVEQLRMGARLAVDWNLLDPLPEVAVPTLALQSLVENAVHHGVEPAPEGGRIQIGLRMEQDHVVATVANPLPRGAARRQGQGHGVGLAAARARIESMQPPGRLQVQVGNEMHVAEIWLPTGG